MNLAMSDVEQRLQNYFGTRICKECESTLRKAGLSKRQAEKKVWLIKAGKLDEAEKIQPAPVQPAPTGSNNSAV